MIKQKYIFLLIFFIVLFFPIGCLKTEHPSSGTISGTVTDYAGTPLSGVKVVGADRSTVTDIRGQYVLTDLKPETITILAHREGYESQTKQVTVVSGQVVSNVNFALNSIGSLYGVVISNITSTGARISFSTKSLATSYVEYGISPLYGNTTPRTATPTLRHTVDLASLTPATTYHVKCVAIDSAGNKFESTNKTFTTNFSRRGDPPSNLQVSKSGNAALLTWNADTSVDLAGYIVYRSMVKSYGWQALNTSPVKSNQYIDSTVSPGQKVYYYVTRVSGIGEESSPSEIVEILLPGITTENIVWTADKNPYILTGDLTIAHGKSLSIQAGTEIRVAHQDSADLSTDNDGKIELRINGALYIEGTPENPVTFTSNSRTPTAGDWVGITFTELANLSVSQLSGTSISFAKTGIKGERGIPIVSKVKIANCSEYGIAFKDARQETLLEKSEIEYCSVGVNVASSAYGKVMITNNTIKMCPKSIVALDNNECHIRFNRISHWSITGIEVRNGRNSTVARNVLGPGGSGVAITARGLDEIRRNTMHGFIGIEISDNAQTRILSNLILADKNLNAIGIFYNGSSNYSVGSHTISGNNIWNQDTENLRHRDKSGNALVPAIGSLLRDPKFAGGNPFGIATLTFDYQPLPGSPIKGMGFGGEDIGAYDIP